MAEMTIKGFFEEKLPKALATPGKVAGFNAVYQFIVTGDDGGTWSIRLKDDKAEIIKGPVDDAQCTLTVTSEDWLAILSGDLNAQMAFMSGKLKIEGDLSLAMRLNTFL